MACTTRPGPSDQEAGCAATRSVASDQVSSPSAAPRSGVDRIRELGHVVADVEPPDDPRGHPCGAVVQDGNPGGARVPRQAGEFVDLVAAPLAEAGGRGALPRPSRWRVRTEARSTTPNVWLDRAMQTRSRRGSMLHWVVNPARQPASSPSGPMVVTTMSGKSVRSVKALVSMSRCVVGMVAWVVGMVTGAGGVRSRRAPDPYPVVTRPTPVRPWIGSGNGRAGPAGSGDPAGATPRRGRGPGTRSGAAPGAPPSRYRQSGRRRTR